MAADLRGGRRQSEHFGRTAERKADRRPHLQKSSRRLQPVGPDHRKGPSKRHEIFYFGESTLGAVRIDDFKYRFIEQPNGWLGGKVQVDAPSITNLRLDPFERLGTPANGTLDGAQGYFQEWFLYEFWRFVFVQEEVAKLAQTAIEYPPMQRGASFNLDAVKAKIEEAVRAHRGQ